MFSNFFYCCSVFLLFLAQGLQANDSTAIVYAQALEAQNNSQYTKAIELYNEILSKEVFSAELYNNLGLAYCENKQLGKAIVQFERGLHINPKHEDLQHNLLAAQQRIQETFQAPEDLFFIRWWKQTAQALSSNSWGIVFLCMLFLGLGCIALWMLQQQTKFRTIGIFLLAINLFPFLWGMQQKEKEMNSNTAIVIKKQVGLRQAPELSSQEIELIFEGVKVCILDEQGDWVHIQLPNHLIGWIPSQMIETI